MNTKLTIKNFRVFDEDGVTVDLKPITVLTGCNSSGKSSVVKAVNMLNKFCSQGIDLKMPMSKDGGFNGVLHQGSTSNKITIEHTFHSFLISENVTIKIVFSNKDNDKLGNAFVGLYEISNENDIIYSQKNFRMTPQGFRSLLSLPGSSKLETINLNLLKERCCEFVRLADLYCTWKRLKAQQQIDYIDFWANMDNIEKSKYQTMSKMMNENKIEDYIIESCAISSEQRIQDIINYCATKQGVMDAYWKNITKDFKLIDKMQETGFLFYVPVLEKMDKMDKDEFKIFIQENTKNNYITPELANDVIDRFDGANEKQFGEFFKNLEKDYLNNYTRIYGGNTAKADDFNSWIRFLMYLNDKLTNGQKCEYYTKYKEWPPLHTFFNCSSQYAFSHKTEEMLELFLNNFIEECISPLWYNGMSYISSSRANIKRLYSFDSNDEFTKALKVYLESSNNDKSFIDKWVKNFGIGESISFHTIEEGLGGQIRLHKTSEDEKGRLLADEGYGITQLFSILLQIELQKKSKCLTIAIEEPEIHLHPKYQSLLADMFVDAYKTFGLHFIIETHSEYLIRRLQLLVAGIDTDAEKKLDKNDVSIAYIYTKEEAEKENQPRVKNISIFENGYLSGTFGKGFFDEATKLSRKLM